MVRTALLLTGVALAVSVGPAASAEALPHSGRIAFVAGTGIASMNPDGSGIWSVELGPSATSPAWSPDGRRLASVSRWPGNEGIVLTEPDGSNPRRLTTGTSDADPAWSPDGKTIAVASDGDLVLVSVDTGARTPLTQGLAFDRHPSWSPDGRRIAFARFEAYGEPDVYVLDLATGSEVEIAAGVAPAWSPGGSEIAFGTSGGIRAVRADGTGERVVTQGFDGSPAWSPDGTQLAFVREGAVWVVGRDGTGERRLTGGWSSSAPAWQPLPDAAPGCTLVGTAGNDLLVGTEGDDIACGLDGDDSLIGLGGRDRLSGGPGRDWIAGGPGFDRLFGEGGDDRLDARDGASDYVIGGTGRDVALVEPFDGRYGIERGKVDGNLAAWRPTTSSTSTLTNAPVHAVDGRADDWWSSGAWPPQWIEIDLERPLAVGRIRLVAGSQPKGSISLVLGRGPATDGAYRLLAVLRGPTAAFQEVVREPKRPWRGIRFLRVVTPGSNVGEGWVSWHEIEVYAPRGKRGA